MELRRSEPGILRGVHIHLSCWEYYVLLAGRTSIGFRDVRRGAPTDGLTGVIEVAGDRLCAVITPPGIAHGIYFHEPSVLLVGTTAYWDLANELGCHWADPDLGIPGQVATARLSDRDEALPSLRQLADRLLVWEPTAPRSR